MRERNFYFAVFSKFCIIYKTYTEHTAKYNAGAERLCKKLHVHLYTNMVHIHKLIKGSCRKKLYM